MECTRSSGSCGRGAWNCSVLRSQSYWWQGRFYPGSCRTGHCNGHRDTQIQQWHPRAQVVLAGLGLAARKRSRGLKINIAPYAVGNGSPFLGHRKEGWSMRAQCWIEVSGCAVQMCFICIWQLVWHLVLPGQRVFPAKSSSHQGHCPVTPWLFHSSPTFISLPFSWT